MSGMKMYCGVDPGRDKFGLALATPEILYFSAILRADDAGSAMDRIAAADWGGLRKESREGVGVPAGSSLAGVYLGNGTCHKGFAEKLTERSISYSVVDEAMTTLRARELYWRLHPPTGLWRLVPRSLRVPPRPIDDLAAWAIIRRALERERA